MTTNMAGQDFTATAAQFHVSGFIRTVATVKISASQGALTINGKVFGTEAEAPKPAKPATVVNFPKGG